MASSNAPARAAAAARAAEEPGTAFPRLPVSGLLLGRRRLAACGRPDQARPQGDADGLEPAAAPSFRLARWRCTRSVAGAMPTRRAASSVVPDARTASSTTRSRGVSRSSAARRPAPPAGWPRRSRRISGAEQHLAAVGPLDDGEDLVHAGALGQDPVGARGDRLVEDVRLGVAGEQEEPRPGPLPLDEAQHVGAAAVGQRVVDEDDVGRLLVQQRPDLLRRGALPTKTNSPGSRSSARLSRSAMNWWSSTRATRIGRVVARAAAPPATCRGSPHGSDHPRPRGAGAPQRRTIRASHALGCGPGHRFETAKLSGSILSTYQSRENVALISPWVTRRGPSSPGVCSEKHSRWRRPPGLHHGGEARRVQRPVGVREGVEAAGVDHGPERRVEARDLVEREHVADEELGREAARARLCPRPLDGGLARRRRPSPRGPWSPRAARARPSRSRCRARARRDRPHRRRGRSPAAAARCPRAPGCAGKRRPTTPRSWAQHRRPGKPLEPDRENVVPSRRSGARRPVISPRRTVAPRRSVATTAAHRRDAAADEVVDERRRERLLAREVEAALGRGVALERGMAGEQPVVDRVDGAVLLPARVGEQELAVQLNAGMS